MDRIPTLSLAVYEGLCHNMGTPMEVRMRREVDDTIEFVEKPVDIFKGINKMKSGSKREGFRLENSDLDVMIWSPGHKVICDLSQINLHSIQNHSLILMDNEDLPPGFTRLNLLSETHNNIQAVIIYYSCILINEKLYISSALFRSNQLQILRYTDIYSSAFLHGPCSTWSTGHLDMDFAFCFRSHHWPPIALPWIHRCRQQGWPSEVVISDILRSGFHVVPIGSTPENGEEWRISFSAAEQKLVYSLNHCQFLCYGLFKCFLKEVINIENNEPVLCSYFTKTILFWFIQSNTSLTWTPYNLLSCFWESFKSLIYWVNMGECPNFFVPQNNMFRKKVSGSIQTELFSQLYNLYCKGISCLLLSQSLRHYICEAILYRKVTFCNCKNSITALDRSFFKELSANYSLVQQVEEFAAYMKRIESLVHVMDCLTPYQRATIQNITSKVLINTAMLIQSTIYSVRNCNKVDYKGNKVCKLLKLSSTLGFVSDSLYLAMYFYRTRRYEHSLSCLHKVLKRMSVPFLMYNAHVNDDFYKRCTDSFSLSIIMKRAVVGNIMLHSDFTYIHELVPEQKISKKNGRYFLTIPPLVMLHMLFILNHQKLDDSVRTQKSLSELKNLLLYDKRVYVSLYLRDISWQILGICQQICGDSLDSLLSYQRSLKQIPDNKIQDATLLRIDTLSIDAM